MRAFKYPDTIVSTGLIFLFIVLYRIEAIEPDEFYVAYMTTGGWQLFSMLVHFANKWFTQKGSPRYYYHKVVAWYLPSVWLLAIVVGWLPFPEKYQGDIWTYTVNISSTIMAVFYTALCCIELISAKPGAEKNSKLS